MKKDSVNKSKKKIFLSHSGKDKEYAIEIAKKIEVHLKLISSSFEFEIFNTSHQRYRFKEFEKMVLVEESFKEKYFEWEKELIMYLKKNLLASDIYLLLVTKRSLLENSKLILWEMKLADKEARKRKASFFIPCLYNGASFAELPTKAEYFQGVDLNSEEGFIKLKRELIHFLKITDRMD